MDCRMSLSQKRMPPLFLTPTRRDQHNLVLQITSGNLRGTREAAETEAKSLVCSGVGWSWVHVMALLFTCCVTLGKLLKLCASPFPLFLFFFISSFSKWGSQSLAHRVIGTFKACT